MMRLVRGRNVVLGFTCEDLKSLGEGQVLYIRGEDMAAPGLCVFMLAAESDASLEADLIAAGYDLNAKACPQK